MKMLVPEDAEPKGPHPGFAHLLPFASLTGEGDNLTKLLPYPPKWGGEVVARGTKPFSPDSSALPRARTFNHRLLKERAICVNSTMRN